MKESQNIEWKKVWKDEYLKWICGFANAKGGEIFLGVNDEGQVIGLEKPEKLLEDLPNKIRDALGLMPDINLLQDSSCYYLQIIVTPSTVPISLRGSYYWRSGSTKQELKGNALTDFLMKKFGMTWDRLIEEDAGLDDIDETAIDHFKKLAQRAGRLPDLSELSKEEVLKKLRLLTRKGLTKAAIILFAKDPAEFYPNLFVKMGRFGTSHADLKFQEVSEGNLFFLAEDILDILEKKFLIKNIHFEGLYRIEELQYPKIALREALLNALVHRNYLGSMTQIKVFDKSLSIWNAGTLPEELSIEDLFKPHESIPRNPLIADVCYKAGLIDSWGRGIEKISEQCQALSLETPTVSERSQGYLIEFLAQNGELDGGLNQNGRLNGELDGGLNLEVECIKEPLRTLYDTIQMNPGLQAKDLSIDLNRPFKTLTKQIAMLITQGFIERRGNRKTGGYYLVGSDFIEGAFELNEALEELVAEIRQKPGIQMNELTSILGRSIKTLEKQIPILIAEALIERRGSRKAGGYYLIEDKQD